jgi:large subunit ribosomal protein L31
MKPDIHPAMHDLKIVMTDGTTFETKSASKIGNLILDTCIKSHVAWTGKKTALNERASEVAKFNKKFAGFSGMFTAPKAAE